MKELELEAEAEKYSDYSNDNIPLSFGGKYNESHKRTFIAGAKSKYVERQKLEFAIEQLNKIQVNVFAAFAEYEVAKSCFIMLSSQIKELEQNFLNYDIEKIKSRTLHYSG